MKPFLAKFASFSFVRHFSAELSCGSVDAFSQKNSISKGVFRDPAGCAMWYAIVLREEIMLICGASQIVWLITLILGLNQA